VAAINVDSEIPEILDEFSLIEQFHSPNDIQGYPSSLIKDTPYILMTDLD
jgi:hypothetical protein